jgi:putative ABC transport system substrate-binding protein
MRRRDFIALVGASAAGAALPRAVFAQQAAKVPRVAHLDTPRAKWNSDGLFQGLADRGYIDGKNIVVEWFTAPTAAELPGFAAKAVASAPTVIVAGTAPAALAAAQLTKTIPIIFRTPLDPVRLGWFPTSRTPAATSPG